MPYEDLRYDSPRNAGLLANMLYRHGFPNGWETAEIEAQTYLGGPVIVDTIPAVVGAGKVSYFRRGENAICLFDGISTLADGLRVALGYGTPLGLLNQPSAIRPWNEQAQAALSMITHRGLGGVTNIQLAGHSGGGAVAIFTHWLLSQLEAPPRLRTATFGSPRPGNLALSVATETMLICRWFFRKDPVPYAPPRFTEAPATWMSTPLIQTFSWRQFYQCGMGMECEDPNPVPAVLPTGVVPIRDLCLGSWILGTSLVYDWKHDIGDYANYFALWTAPREGDRPAPVIQAGPERRRENLPDPAPAGAGPTQDEINRAFAAMNSNARRRVPDGMKFYVERTRPGWGVFEQGIQCCICTTRRKALQVASGLNKAARFWVTAPISDLSSLVHAIGNEFNVPPS